MVSQDCCDYIYRSGNIFYCNIFFYNTFINILRFFTPNYTHAEKKQSALPYEFCTFCFRPGIRVFS